MGNAGHRTAVAQALVVTFLWSTSWVLIKWGIDTVPALTFAGLRYTLASLCLLPFLLHPRYRTEVRGLSRREWVRLILLGVLWIAVTQGAQYIGLAALPAVTVSMLLNFTTLLVAVLGMITLKEFPSRFQWAGVALFLLGVSLYFYPVNIPEGQGLAVFAVFLGILANSVSSILGRSINREARISTPVVTGISMTLGAVLILGAGLLLQGLPVLGWREWAMIAWLAVVNTAFAFTLWNQTLRSLSAVESSIINGTMMIQIAFLAWIFLGEALTLKTGLGVIISAAGAWMVQKHRST